MEERTQEEMILINEMFDLKAKLQFPIKDVEKEEKMLQRINEIRDRLAEIKVEQILKEDEEERKIGNGKF
jgi:hypothetical protein